MSNLKGKPAPLVTEAELDAEIARLETELKLARESIEALKGGAFGNQQGFAEYLRAFSRQSIGGLWLTGFNIAGSGELEIRGRALSPDLLPSYIQRLNRERVLAGRSIAQLEMSRPKPEPVADKDKRRQGPGARRAFSNSAWPPRTPASRGRSHEGAVAETLRAFRRAAVAGARAGPARP